MVRSCSPILHGLPTRSSLRLMSHSDAFFRLFFFSSFWVVTVEPAPSLLASGSFSPFLCSGPFFPPGHVRRSLRPSSTLILFSFSSTFLPRLRSSRRPRFFPAFTPRAAVRRWSDFCVVDPSGDALIGRSVAAPSLYDLWPVETSLPPFVFPFCSLLLSRWVPTFRSMGLLRTEPPFIQALDDPR